MQYMGQVIKLPPQAATTYLTVGKWHGWHTVVQVTTTHQPPIETTIGCFDDRETAVEQARSFAREHKIGFRMRGAGL